MERREIQAILEAHGPEAVSTLVQLMRQAEHERIRLEAARAILEYGGHKAAAIHDVRFRVDHAHAHVLSVQEAWKRRRARVTAAESVEEPDARAAPAFLTDIVGKIEDLGKNEKG